MGKVELPWLYYGLAIFQALHSTEEVLTGLWRWMPRVTVALHERLGWFPAMQDMGETNFAVANLLIVTGFLVLVPFLFEHRRWALSLAFWIAVIEIVNGTGHLTAAIAFRGYFPGVIAGLGLILFGFLYVKGWQKEKAVHERR